ncbi:RluA family pseudouridine synthase [Paludibacterium denitrificans]|uniref:RluA family pseudouridine synthase n=1 Tax=Paludibacterium denitrificans TaxID=2675226 RepID=UPI001E479610
MPMTAWWCWISRPGCCRCRGAGKIVPIVWPAAPRARFADALIVHRLDMSTSGLIVMGRGPQWQRALSVAFQDRQVHKRYQAVVAGLLSPESGVVDLPLLTDWPNRPRQKVDHELGKRAQTRYRLLAHDVAAATSRVELEPITGRTHQLRVHMQQLGHPILGDDLYADEVACLAGAAAVATCLPVGAGTSTQW